MPRSERNKTTDPLLRGCRTCGALKGQGCREVGGDTTMISRDTRLVHVGRLEGTTDA